VKLLEGGGRLRSLISGSGSPPVGDQLKNLMLWDPGR
jgi:hypothetical protein